MKNKVLLVALGVLSAIFCFANIPSRSGQSLFGDQKTKIVYNKQQNVTEVPRAPQSWIRHPKKEKRISSVQKKDSARYLALAKRFGWYYGIGRQLSKKEAAHVSCYFLLTELDSAGHFNKIEALDGNGSHTNGHGLKTYLSDNAKSGKEMDASDIRAYLPNVVQWRLFPSADRKHLSMESAYDADGNQIYSYILTQLNDSVAVGHYADSFGEPISLMQGNNAANFIQVSYDSLGYERKIQYIDPNAYFRRNSDGAFMVRKNYDSAGNNVLLISCTLNGIPVKDDWGYSGWSASYNDMGQIVNKTYLDDDLKPKKLSPSDSHNLDIMSRRFFYDSWNRLVKESYFNVDGKKDFTAKGIHSKEWRYDDSGKILSIVTRDTLGNLCGDKDKIAMTRFVYTPDGDTDSIVYFDKNSLLVNDPSGVCVYAGKSKYENVDGRKTRPIYTEVQNGNVLTVTDYKNNFIHILKTNKEDDEIESAYYDLNMKPVEVDGYFLQKTSFRKDVHREIRETETFSFTDTLRTVTISDLKEHTRIQRIYNKDLLLSSFGQTLSDDMETVAGQYGFDALGNIARSHLEDALYYKVKSGTTYRGKTSYIVGLNEYDELSYVNVSESLDSDIFCTKLFGKDGRPVLLDENNNEIEDVKAFRDSLNKVYCIEVMSQSAVDLGLRSGDIIVKYGDFYYPEPVSDVWINRDQLQVETFLTRDSKKELLLLRYFPQAKRHKLLNISLPVGTPEDFGFIIQTVFCTQKETERFKNIVDDYLSQNNLAKVEFVTNPDHYGNRRVCLLRPFKVSTGIMPSWRDGLRQDVIVLGVLCRHKKGDYTYVDISKGVEKLWNQFVAEGESYVLYYTVNGKDVKNVVLSDIGSALTRSHYLIPKEEFVNLVELSSTIVPNEEE